MSRLRQVLRGIHALPPGWHGHGTLPAPALNRLADLLEHRVLEHSVETGVGKSTLLLSHASRHHMVFTIDDVERGSLNQIKSCALLKPETVEFVIGPTQRTLLGAPNLPLLDLALIDGPHAYPFPELEYFAIYPRLAPEALLIIDDVHIPTVRHLFDFIAEDSMFEPLEVVATTAFLRRTNAPLFDPYGDSWNHQAFNARRFPDYSRTPDVGLKQRILGRMPPVLRETVTRYTAQVIRRR